MFDLLMTLAKIATIAPLAVVIGLMVYALRRDVHQHMTRKDLPK